MTTYLYHSPCIFIILICLVFLSCKSEKELKEETDSRLRESRIQKVFTGDEIRALLYSPYQDVLRKLGKPDQTKFFNPGFGTVVYDSIQIRSNINGEVQRYKLILGVRSDKIDEVSIL